MKRSDFLIRTFLVMACLLMLAGCGRDESLDAYKESMEEFYQHVAAIDESINSIDPAMDPDGTQLLSLLDELDGACSEMAALEVPSQFSAVESLADEASTNMTEAVSLYHQLYESEYDENVASAAYEYYERANLRIRYITDILHGNLPEEYVVDESADDYNDFGDSDESDEGDEFDTEPEDEVYYFDVEEE